jgi:O-antigen ligase
MLYFSLITLFGRNGFSIDVETNEYIGMVAVVDAIAALFFVHGFSSQKNKGAGSFLIPFALGIILMLYLVSNTSSNLLINNFIAFSIPCAIVAIDIALKKSIGYLAKWIELFMIVVTAAIAITLPMAMFARELDFEYQSYSYYAGFAFCINFFFLLFGNKYERFRFFKSRFYFFFSIGLLFLQAGASLISGGRGGFLLVILSLAVFLYLFNKNSATKKRISLWLLIPVVIALFFVIAPSYFFDAMSSGSRRTFSYVSGGYINMTETSGRDEVYASAIALFEQKPVFGYGFFDYVDSLHYYPHNIFLEILLQGGLVFLMFFIVFLLYIIRKFKRIIKYDNDNLLVLAMALWPAVELLFSASYVMFGLFWFIVSYVVCYDLTPHKHTRKSILASQNC